MNSWPHTLFKLGLLALGLLFAASAAFLLDMSASTRDQTIRFLAGPSCRAYDPHTLIITTGDGITTLCVTGMETKPLAWRLSRDGSRLAFALPAGVTPKPQARQYPNYLPESMWFVVDRTGDNLQRFRLADNTWLSLSVDGQYAQVPLPCSLASAGRCSYQINQIDSGHMVCRYEVWSLFYSYGDAKCTSIPLRNGQIWDVRKESNDRACAFWGPKAQNFPTCAGSK